MGELALGKIDQWPRTICSLFRFFIGSLEVTRLAVLVDIPYP